MNQTQHEMSMQNMNLLDDLLHQSKTSTSTINDEMQKQPDAHDVYKMVASAVVSSPEMLSHLAGAAAITSESIPSIIDAMPSSSCDGNEKQPTSTQDAGICCDNMGLLSVVRQQVDGRVVDDASSPESLHSSHSLSQNQQHVSGIMYESSGDAGHAVKRSHPFVQTSISPIVGDDSMEFEPPCKRGYQAYSQSLGADTTTSSLSSSTDKEAQKPSTSYVELIAMAILSKPEKKMLIADIYSWLMERFPYFTEANEKSWRNSVRHNLSLMNCFVKLERAPNGRGYYWSIEEKFMAEFEAGNFGCPGSKERKKPVEGKKHKKYFHLMNACDSPVKSKKKVMNRQYSSTPPPLPMIHISVPAGRSHSAQPAYPSHENLLTFAQPLSQLLPSPGDERATMMTSPLSNPAGTSTTFTTLTSPHAACIRPHHMMPFSPTAAIGAYQYQAQPYGFSYYNPHSQYLHPQQPPHNNMATVTNMATQSGTASYYHSFYNSQYSSAAHQQNGTMGLSSPTYDGWAAAAPLKSDGSNNSIW